MPTYTFRGIALGPLQVRSWEVHQSVPQMVDVTTFGDASPQYMPVGLRSAETRMEVVGSFDDLPEDGDWSSFLFGLLGGDVLLTNVVWEAGLDELVVVRLTLAGAVFPPADTPSLPPSYAEFVAGNRDAPAPRRRRAPRTPKPEPYARPTRAIRLKGDL